MNDQSRLTKTEMIERRIDTDNSRSLTVSNDAGGALVRTMDDLMNISRLMATGGIAVREHLRDQPGVCASIIMQAMSWNIAPYALANKSYVVNNQVAYESSVLQAVIQARAPIKGRIKTKYHGEGLDRSITVRAEYDDEPGEFAEYTSPKIRDIRPQNSPLWKNDPDQQLHYFGCRAWARRHFPDVILGVYAKDELEDAEPMREVNPRPKAVAEPKGMKGKVDILAGKGQTIDHETGEITETKTKVVEDSQQVEDAQYTEVQDDDRGQQDETEDRGDAEDRGDPNQNSNPRGHSQQMAQADEIPGVKSKMAEPEPERKADPEPDPEPKDTRTQEQIDADDNRIEEILVHELTDPPAGIDTESLPQLEAYLSGRKAKQKGRSFGASPKYKTSEELAAWRAGHKSAVKV